MWTVHGHGGAHGKGAEGGYGIEIQRKGMDGTSHDADEVDLVDEYMRYSLEYSYMFRDAKAVSCPCPRVVAWLGLLRKR